MIYRSGKIEIKTQGIAQSEGSIGKFIQVKNSKSDIVLRARVQGNGVVLVEGLQVADAEDNNKISSVEGHTNENN